MMDFFKKLSGKEIAMIITSVGGIVLAGFLIWINWNISTNHLEHSIRVETELTASIKGMADNQKETTEIIRSFRDTQKEFTFLLKNLFNRQ